jgi:hypothetical protein
MNATELVTLSMSELKAICVSHAIDVVGDKRSKATYINAIESFQSEQTVIEIETLPAIPDPFECATEVYQPIDLMEAAEMAECHSTLLNLYTAEDVTASTAPIAESIVQPISLAIPPTAQHRQASIVALVALLLFGTAFLVVRIGFTSLVWVIASLAPVMAGWWRYLVQSPTVTQAIDYEPLPV